jgi:UPF0176 protein
VNTAAAPDRNVVVAFYKFVTLPDYAELRAPLLESARQHSVKGTILLAEEGINSTLSGPSPGIEAVLAFLRQDSRLADLVVKYSAADTATFDRLKVRLKREIVTLGQPQVDPTRKVGTYVAPTDWNKLIEDPDVLLIDTRNAYEVGIGTFKGAVNPNTRSFSEFPAYVEDHLQTARKRKVAMFCTGGIRCEKASSYLLSQGFEEVYHLEGGILKYLETVPADASLWQGECYVFDQRVSLGHGLSAGTHDACRACGFPISAADKASPAYREGVACPHCADGNPGVRD